MTQFIKPDLTKERGFILRDSFYAEAKKFPFHYDRYSRISIILSGGLREVVHDREEFGTAMSIVVKPCDAKHLNEFSPQGARILSIEWDADQTPDLLAIPSLANWQWRHGTAHAAAATQFLTQLYNAKKCSEIEAGIIDLIANLQVGKNSHFKTPPQWLQGIAERLCDEHAEPPQVQQLAAEAGVHPVYLARIFRQFYGCSIKDYLHQFRVRQAVHALASTDTPLVHVALDQGFADQSHLNRLFKREMGLSPGQFRKLAQVSFVQD